MGGKLNGWLMELSLEKGTKILEKNINFLNFGQRKIYSFFNLRKKYDKFFVF